MQLQGASFAFAGAGSFYQQMQLSNAALKLQFWPSVQASRDG